MKSPAGGSSDLIYNNWKSSETTYKSYNSAFYSSIYKRILLVFDFLISFFNVCIFTDYVI